MKHKHAKLMAQYAWDALETDKPWERWEVLPAYCQRWQRLKGTPRWGEDAQYRRIEPKPPEVEVVYYINPYGDVFTMKRGSPVHEDYASDNSRYTEVTIK